MPVDDSDAWKSEFEIILCKNSTTRFIIKKPQEMSFGNTMICLKSAQTPVNDNVANTKSIDNERILGQIIFIPQNTDGTVATMTRAKNHEFEIFEKILFLNGINLSLKKEWGFDPIHPKKNETWTVLNTLVIKSKLHNMPDIFSDKHTKVLEKTYEKLQNHKEKEKIYEILYILMFSGSDSKMNFFTKWIAFNCIYKRHKKDNDKNAIIKVAKIFSKFNESGPLRKNNFSIIESLYEKSKSLECRDKNIYQNFKKALTEKNNHEIWKSVFLVMYYMRNNFFHEYKIDENFEDVSNLLNEISLIYLRHLIKDISLDGYV